MDPYLETHWGDVHISLITSARDQLQSQMPTGLHVRAEEYVSVQADEDLDGLEEVQFRPDVYVHEPRRSRSRASARTAGTAVAEPVLVPLRSEPRTRRRLRVVESQSGNRVVTAIEFLSPWNKHGPTARRQYWRRRRALLRGKANFVEIDLHRLGPYILAAPLEFIPNNKRTMYRACVIREARPDRVEYYPFSLRERLPSVPIPLRSTDRDATLDLQALVNEAHEKGDYEDADYSVEPEPPLPPADAAWADKLLHAKGLR
jgi:hypothetical protein